MRLPSPFIRLPYKFDAEKLKREVSIFEKEDWQEHPAGYKGNYGLPLVSTDGEINDYNYPPMLPNKNLEKLAYVKSVMGSFGTIIGRSRIMKLDPGSSVNKHVDLNHYWRNHVRIHVPIITDQNVRFVCEGEEVNMKEGEAWIFDNWRQHYVENKSNLARIHLVIDTVGTSSFWKMVEGISSIQIANLSKLTFECFKGIPIFTPSEILYDISQLEHDVTDKTEAKPYLDIYKHFYYVWQSLWVTVGPDPTKIDLYRRLVKFAKTKLVELDEGPLLHSNSIGIKMVIESSLNSAVKVSTPPLLKSRKSKRLEKIFDRPIFIISAPRSGSTYLFEAMNAHEKLISLNNESHEEFESIRELHPFKNGYCNNKLVAEDASKEVVTKLKNNFLDTLNLRLDETDYSGKRFLEKTPKNILRIPFLNKAFPEALFIYLYREPKENISSLLESWRSGKFQMYKNLPGWKNTPWSHLLIPNWRDLSSSSLLDIVQEQWFLANKCALNDLDKISPARRFIVSYQELNDNMPFVISNICNKAQLDLEPEFLDQLKERPLSKYTLTPPHSDKWRRNEREILRINEKVYSLYQQITEFSLANR